MMAIWSKNFVLFFLNFEINFYAPKFKTTEKFSAATNSARYCADVPRTLLLLRTCLVTGCASSAHRWRWRRPNPLAACATGWACPARAAWPSDRPPCCTSSCVRHRLRRPAQDRWPEARNRADARRDCWCSLPSGMWRPAAPCCAPLPSARRNSCPNCGPDWHLSNATRTGGAGPTTCGGTDVG